MSQKKKLKKLHRKEARKQREERKAEKTKPHNAIRDAEKYRVDTYAIRMLKPRPIIFCASA